MTDQQLPEATRWLLEQQTLVRAPKREPLPTPITGGGSAPTVVVASSESTQYSKDRADFRCTGVNDEMTVQRALNVCALTGGIVWLCEGGYYFEVPTTGPAITIPPTTALWGVGESTDGAAALDMSNASDPGRQAMVRMGNHTQIRGLTIYCYDSVLPIQFATNATVLKVVDCWLEPRDVACIEGSGNSLIWIERNVLVPGGAPTDEDDSSIHLTGNGLVDIWIQRNYMSSGWHGVFIDGDQGKNYIRDNEMNQMWYSGVRLKNDVNPIFATKVAGNVISVPGVDADGSTGDAGIYVTADGADIDPTTAQNLGLDIHDNTVEVGGAIIHGIRISDICLVNCHDNYIEQQGMHGIFLENANDNQVHGNTIQEPNTFPTTTFDGISLEGSDRNYVYLNKLVEHRGGSPNYYRYGINVSDAASDDNAIFLNDLRLAGSGTDFFNDAGTGTLVDPPSGAPYGSNLT